MQSESFVGFNTDPLRSGYQTLSNYESTFWRAYTGVEAWALYEILRSFCHTGKSECNPSILLLCSILNIADRRTLIGRTKRKRGQLIIYDGLMSRLQAVELLYTTVRGEGGGMRYIFHVNLTPSLLGDQELSTISPLLQRKHAELLERCRKNAEKTEEMKKQSVGQSTSSVGQSLPQSGTIPTKQNQLNNTQEQLLDKDQENAVKLLVEAGMTKSVARNLVSMFGAARAEEKLRHLSYLRRMEPHRIRSPHGWLRKAIEEDYAPPEGYIDPSEPTPLERYIEEIAQQEKGEGGAFIQDFEPEKNLMTILDERFREELGKVYSGEMERIGHLIQVEDKVGLLAIPDCWFDWVVDRLGTKIQKVGQRIELEQIYLVQQTLAPSLSLPARSNPSVSFSLLEHGSLPALSGGASWTHSFPIEKGGAIPTPV